VLIIYLVLSTFCDLQDPNRLAGIGAEEAPPIEEATRISFGISSGIS
jgi:hypothetical protein